MKSRINLRKVAFHIVVWVAAFFIGIILVQGYSVRINWTNTFFSWGCYLFIFYINYLLLIPYLMKRRWTALYFVFALAVLAGSFVSIKYMAVRSARNNAAALGEQLLTYEDVKPTFNEKERLREHQREIERMREQQKGDKPANGGPGKPDGRRGQFDGQGPHFPGRGAEGTFERILRSDSTLLDSTLADSLIRIERARQDSILSRDIAFSSREEEYGQLRREFEQLRWYNRFLLRGGYNPFSQHNLQFIFALIFFYMASIAVFFIEQAGKAEKRRREMEKEKASAELAYLKQQINPHFLFNTLNSIYSYTIGVSEEASDAVLKLSSILRYMLYETNRDRVPLVDELAVVDNYIDLQRLRTTDKTEIEVVTTGDMRLHRIEPMLLIPIIENAFKYGVDSVEDSFVRIEIGVKGSDFTFRVTNKVVRRNDGDGSHSGIGLNNIRRRLDLIYGYGNYGMEVKEKGGIFSVTLRLSLKD